MKKLLLATPATALLAGAASAADIKLGIILGFTGPIESLTPSMAAGAELAERGVQVAREEQPRDCGRLAARDEQAGERCQLLRFADLARLGALFLARRESFVDDRHLDGMNCQHATISLPSNLARTLAETLEIADIGIARLDWYHFSSRCPEQA